MIREAAERTGEAVGDGTTTAAVLAHAILSEGVRTALENAVSVASILLLTEATLTEVPEPKRPLPSAHELPE